jgi:hypothetical protein
MLFATANGGRKQRFGNAVDDRIGLEPDPQGSP